ncbi:helix-turn-helix domain-containing protein [Starkeya sp. 3C]|uniref:Helix-turn-helix domain-containing protein n=1 Tax=Ancylobacter moscoviensis TaxID=2597768 RepID=A0ABY3DNF0_9HYPH|nr:helix-turn-helix domain-containing protein [Ancylobacter moscoviensis]TSJ60967.1 helix-turn-helix domain-containing protein [Ancylobacter moscoviensis]
MQGSAYRVFDTAEEYLHTVRAAQVQAAVHERGTFRGELARIDFSRLWLQRGSENLARSLHISIPKARAPIFFLTDAAQPSTRLSGIEVQPGELVFWGRESEQYQRTDAAIRWGAMSLEPDALIRAALAILGHEIFVPAKTLVLRPNEHAMRRLVALHHFAGALAKSAPDVIAHKEVANALEQAMVHAMLAAIDCSEEKAPASGHRYRQHILERLEAFIARNAGRPLYLTELCESLGAPERTLRRVFTEQFGISPTRYLWLRRMHLVNRALQLADPACSSVTAIAMEHGFPELGRFATAYRQLFGEVPSATLRRKPDFVPRILPSSYLGLIPFELRGLPASSTGSTQPVESGPDRAEVGA